jgi:hypothetical protein
MFINDSREWAQFTFGQCELGDPRRTARLITIATSLADHVGDSLSQAADSDSAKHLGGYRFIRNPHVDPEAILEGGAKSTAELVAQSRGKTFLAVEDTTTLGYRHGVASELGDLGGKENAKQRGWLVHTVLLVDPQDRQVQGLLDQFYWLRSSQERGKSRHTKERHYEDKESVKWQRASERVSERLGKGMASIISVCDRESDVFEYLHYKLAHQQRFVVRSQVDRRICDESHLLYQKLRQSPSRTTRRVHVSQHGNQPGYWTEVEVRSAPVMVRPPISGTHLAKSPQEDLSLWGVLVTEIDAPTNRKPLLWILLTSEPAETSAQCQTIVDYYEQRWVIEDYHKAWKTGCRVEEQRMQEPENLQRMAVILAFEAVRLLQIEQSAFRHPHTSCAQWLDPLEWMCLWVAREKGQPIPPQAPTNEWAYEAVARLGGWMDTKQSGRASWATLWRGWQRLKELVAGWELAMNYQNQKGVFPE